MCAFQTFESVYAYKYFTCTDIYLGVSYLCEYANAYLCRRVCVCVRCLTFSLGGHLEHG